MFIASHLHSESYKQIELRFLIIILKQFVALKIVFSNCLCLVIEKTVIL